ncbi:MAG: hypothetical protein ACI4OH_09570 [Mitsuokella sp.]|uniref:hypothetical protein n=1 Tax=Mitsuokella sp. TaxID=2049034 RepID=UPI003F0559DF
MSDQQQDRENKTAPEDLDKTVLLNKTASFDAAGEKSGSSINAPQGKPAAANEKEPASRLEDTQQLPKMTAAEGAQDGPIRQPFPQQEQEEEPLQPGVRELKPDKDLQKKAKQQEKKKWLTRKRKKALLLIAGFFVAVFIGFALAGYRQDQADLQNNERQHQEQQMQARQQQLDAQEGDLQKQRQALEKKKKDLEQQQRDLERQQGRLEGRSQAMQESADGESGLQKILDKVTGQSDKKQKASADNQQQSADTAAAAADVQQSINDAQQKLDDVQQKLDDVQSLKDEAGKVKDKAADTYAENKDTIDTVLSYAKEGASMLGDLLFH